MHGPFVIIWEPRSGRERVRLKLFQFNQLRVLLLVHVTNSQQKVATLPGPILEKIVTWSSVSHEEYNAVNRPRL